MTPDEQHRDQMTDHEDTGAVERQPWHKPEVRRLAVSLDTSSGGGSFVDNSSPDPFIL